MVLKIVWATGRHYKNDWEYSWICELFKDIPVEFVNLTNMADIYENAIIVFNHDIPYIEYIVRYERFKIPFGLIHLSDEYTRDPIQVYDLTMCKFVLRNCYRLECAQHPKVLQFPLGYKKHFWEGGNRQDGFTRSIATREYVWSFAGGMRENRKHAMELFEKIPYHKHKVVIETGNSFSVPVSGLLTEDYRNLMLQSIFVLCPEGNVSVDCFRVYEALECGCIPIVLKRNSFQWFPDSSYWKVITHSTTEPPFVMEESMEENKTVMLHLLEDPEQLEERRVACWMFWQETKKRLQETIRKKIEASLKI